MGTQEVFTRGACLPLDQTYVRDHDAMVTGTLAKAKEGWPLYKLPYF